MATRKRKSTKKRTKTTRSRRKAPARKTARKSRKAPAKKKAKRRTAIAKKSIPKRRKRRANPAPRKLKAGAVVAGGAGVATGLLAGPAVQAKTGLTGVAGELVAAAVPMALGYVAHRLKKPNLASGLMGSGVALAMLSAFRRGRAYIPIVKDLDVGPLGQIVPKIYTNAASSKLYVKGFDGNMVPIRESGVNLGKVQTIKLDSGRVIRGWTMGQLKLKNKPYTVIYDQGRKRAHLVAGVVATRPDSFAGVVQTRPGFAGVVKAKPRSFAGGVGPYSRPFSHGGGSTGYGY